MTTIALLSHAGALSAVDELSLILADSVDSGASVGFLPPLAVEEAIAYWRDVCADVGRGRVRLFAAYTDGQLAGTVQLQPSPKANGSHRAEVAKLLVHSAFRRRGIARALMTALEAEARRLGRTTLVLDTRQGDPSELLYAGLGWVKAGIIPAYARNGDGGLDATVFYYKLL
ncbi:MAG: GNAT family N-acetyltransferase [Chloroflexi bacterium]|nr:GNAT family N-acetyltransferase [Chloroflexota bacterium]